MNLPNIILIVLDTLRADRVSFKTKDYTFTPFINDLLNHSIFFENCISNSTWTLPSHISMFTGLYESQYSQVNKNQYKLSDKIPVLAEILKDLGYYTVCYTENPWISDHTGLTRGFDNVFFRWMDTYKYGIINKLDTFIKSKTTSHLVLNFWEILRNKVENSVLHFTWKKFFFGRNRNSIKQIEEFNLNLFRKASNQPKFLFFNIMANHAPYYSTKKNLESLDISEKDFKIIKSRFLHTLKNFIEINLESKHISESEMSVLKKFYDASVIYSDSVIKKIFLKLKKSGLLKNSYVIITSDHGELLADQNDHFYWTHGVFHSIYEGMVKIPLIIYNKNFNRKKINEIVVLKDLFHTILHLTGISDIRNQYLKVENSIMHQISNKSTLIYAYGEFIKSKQEMLNRINFHRTTIDKGLIPKLLDNIYFIRTKNYKYIKYGYGIEEMYDVIKDPNEQSNIFDANNEIHKNLKRRLNSFIKENTNKKELEEVITKKEKSSIKKIINNLKFKNI